MNDLRNVELSDICNWLAVNKLSINLSKTDFMTVFTFIKQIFNIRSHLLINGYEIIFVNNAKFTDSQIQKVSTGKLKRPQMITSYQIILQYWIDWNVIYRNFCFEICIGAN